MTGKITVEMELGDEWVVEFTWDDSASTSGPTRLSIRPAEPQNPPAGGLSSTVLRGIDFRAAKASAQRRSAASDRWARATERYQAGRIERLRAALAQGLTDEYLALLSSAYVWATKRIDGNPNEYLAEHLGKSVQTIRGHLWQARKRGLLAGTTGRKGGQLTPEAIAMLERSVPGTPNLLGE